MARNLLHSSRYAGHMYEEYRPGRRPAPRTPRSGGCPQISLVPCGTTDHGVTGIPPGHPPLVGSVGSVKKVVILDYGSGNLRSAERALARVGADVTVTADAQAALDADGLVVPGVGAFAACMQGLRAVDGPRTIGRRLAGGRPVLGICVGMQILFERGVEHGVETEGCDEWPGLVERLQAPIVPHMGWNTVSVPEGSAMFAGVEGERFYFVHSYGVRRWELETHGRTRPPQVTWSEHGGDRFVAAVDNGPLWATQFHPEKSGDAGAQLLRNWVQPL